MEKYISYVKSPLGYIEIIANDEYLLEVNFTNIIKEISSNNITAETAKQLNEYFNYERMSFDMPFKLDGTSFQIKCWQQLLEIPYGSTITYKEQAQLIGHPKAYRAVGQANGKNKLVIIIPCHRVTGMLDNLGGYSGGIHIKKFLLEHEQVGLKRKNFV